MPEVSYDVVIEAPVDVVWEFAKDMKNWAPLIKYYQSFQEVDDRQSIWTMKGEIGPFSRTTKLRVTITEWLEKQRVAFELEGINEPIKGSGSVSISPHGSGDRFSDATSVSLAVSASMLGPAGVLMNRLISPMLMPTVQDLVSKFSAAVSKPPYSPTRIPELTLETDIPKTCFVRKRLSKLRFLLSKFIVRSRVIS